MHTLEVLVTAETTRPQVIPMRIKNRLIRSQLALVSPAICLFPPRQGLQGFVLWCKHNFCKCLLYRGSYARVPYAGWCYTRAHLMA